MKSKLFLTAIFLAALPLISVASTTAQRSCISSAYANYKIIKTTALQTYTQAKAQSLANEKLALAAASKQATTALKNSAAAAARKNYHASISSAYSSYKTTIQGAYANYKNLRSNCLENADIKTAN